MGLLRVELKYKCCSGSLRKLVNMSDTEGDEAPAPVQQPTGAMDINTAVQEVLKISHIHDGLARGLRESVKALDKRQALLCVLANNCDESMYVKLIEALCGEHGINLIKWMRTKSWGNGQVSAKLIKKERLV